MDFSTLPLFHVMRAKMTYLSERQSVLAQNVANADTPGYQAMDIAPPDFAGMLSSAKGQALSMSVTHAGHFTHAGLQPGSYAVEKRRSTYERNPTGNNVVLEEEMMRAGRNQAEYAKVLNLYAKTVSMFKTAIGRPGGGA